MVGGPSIRERNVPRVCPFGKTCDGAMESTSRRHVRACVCVCLNVSGCDISCVGRISNVFCHELLIVADCGTMGQICLFAFLGRLGMRRQTRCTMRALMRRLRRYTTGKHFSSRARHKCFEPVTPRRGSRDGWLNPTKTRRLKK